MARTFHPTGQVTLNSSVLVDADKYNSKIDNALALKATLARRQGIPVFGMHSAEVSWDMLVTNEGPEIEMVKNVTEEQPMELGFKFPVRGVDMTFQAHAASTTVAQSLGDALIVSCVAKGHVLTSSGI